MVLRGMGYESYAAYLLSPLWQTIRRGAFALYGSQCVACQKKATQIHHRDYSPETLKGESLKSLCPICRGCHDKIEFTEDGRKRSLSSANVFLAKLIAGIKAVPGTCRLCFRDAPKRSTVCRKCKPRLKKPKVRRGKLRAKVKAIVQNKCQFCGNSAKKGTSICKPCLRKQPRQPEPSKPTSPPTAKQLAKRERRRRAKLHRQRLMAEIFVPEKPSKIRRHLQDVPKYVFKSEQAKLPQPVPTEEERFERKIACLSFEERVRRRIERRSRQESRSVDQAESLPI